MTTDTLPAFHPDTVKDVIQKLTHYGFRLELSTLGYKLWDDTEKEPKLVLREFSYDVFWAKLAKEYGWLLED